MIGRIWTYWFGNNGKTINRDLRSAQDKGLARHPYGNRVW
jgi:hypothetical protein